MLYILRLSSGNCIVVIASNAQKARSSVRQLDSLHGESVVSIRRLEGFEIKLSPTAEGSLEIIGWNDTALDSILANEYPVLYDAYRRANAQPFAAAAPGTPPLQHLRIEFQRNTEIIRAALGEEQRRLAKGRHVTKDRRFTKEQCVAEEEVQPVARPSRTQR